MDDNSIDESNVPPTRTVYTEREAMTECGINNVDLFEGKTQLRD